MVSKNEDNLKKKEIIFSELDAEELIEYRDVFIKFLEKTKLSYQIELSLGTFRTKEEQLYRSMTTIDEIIKSLEGFLETYQQFKKDKNK